MDPKLAEALVPVLATALLGAIGWILRDWIVSGRATRAARRETEESEKRQRDAGRVERFEGLVAAIKATSIDGFGVNREKWNFAKIQEVWDESRKVFDAESLRSLNEKLIRARSQLQPGASDEEYRAFNEAAEAFVKALSDEIAAQTPN